MSEPTEEQKQKARAVIDEWMAWFGIDPPETDAQVSADVGLHMRISAALAAEAAQPPDRGQSAGREAGLRKRCLSLSRTKTEERNCVERISEQIKALIVDARRIGSPPPTEKG